MRMFLGSLETLLAAALCILLSTAAMADVASNAVRFLQGDGWRVTTVETTWLGRIRIEADRDAFQREMVLDRTSGEVLRDLIYRSDDDDDDDEPGFWDSIFGDDRDDDDERPKPGKPNEKAGPGRDDRGGPGPGGGDNDRGGGPGGGGGGRNG